MTQLATRCTHCGTSFRVSEEQLSISDGYVRCGRCDAVFNARDALFDLEGGNPSQPMPLAPATAPMPLAAAPEPAPVPVPAPEPQWEPEAAPPDELEPQRAEPRWEPEPLEEQDTVPEAMAAVEPPAPEDPNEQLRGLLGVNEAAPASPPVWSSLAAKPRAPKARGGGWMLAAGGLLAALLALGLPLQWAWIEREAFRARSPQLDQWLRQTLPGLRSDGLRQLDTLSVAASSLLATPQGGAYQLDLTLHNRGSQPLAMPWIDLRLSDSQGQLLLRKSVAPAELGQTSALRAGEQRRVQAVFRLRDGRAAVSGYEVGLFHP
jgi:predicted Zn finger-like uncharacterized protein